MKWDRRWGGYQSTMFVNNPIDDEDQKRKKKANFKGYPRDIKERTGSDELNWTRL